MIDKILKELKEMLNCVALVMLAIIWLPFAILIKCYLKIAKWRGIENG
jgi:hypothetical protein